MASATIAAVRAEAAALVNVAAGLADTDLGRPSPCPPWTIADLLGHVIIAVSRIGQVIATPDDVPSEMVTAAGYYRPDHRFSGAVNDDRIATAQALAAKLGMPPPSPRSWTGPVGTAVGYSSRMTGSSAPGTATGCC